MKVEKKYIDNYVKQMIVDQVADQYKANDYLIFKEEKIGDYRADLVAKKGDESVIIEVKSNKDSPEKKHQINQLRKFVKDNKNYKFLLALASPPQGKTIEIENLDNILFKYLERNPPSGLENLATSVGYLSLSDLEVDEIRITADSPIFVKGDASIELSLQFGSNNDLSNDDGIDETMSLPLDFSLFLLFDSDYQLIIDELREVKIKIDTEGLHI